MPFLDLSGVSKGYGAGDERTDVLRDVTLSVEEGEFVAIVGYSGAGKTTLMSLVAGLLAPDRGAIRLAGRPVTGPGPERGVVFQTYALLPWLTAYGNIHLAVDQIFANLTAGEKRRRAEKYLALVGLEAARDKRPSELSGGMRQRVALARALAMDPQVLLMDEPLGALDALTRATMQGEIRRICAETRKTVLMVTNDVDEGLLLADRVIPLSAGPGATLGPPVEVTIPQPRDRKAMNHDPRFRSARNAVLEYLLGPGKRRASPPAPGTPELAPVTVTKEVAA
jgi:nitrate/nitrite transport system ATP-binding protein